MSTWHVAPDDLRAYAAGTAGVAVAASVEAHVVRCPGCADGLRPAVDTRRLDAVWAEVTDRLDTPRRSLLERALHAAGVPEGDARLVAASRSLRRSWFGALAIVAALGVLGGFAGGRGDATGLLLLAPLVPVLGVGLAFGPRTDPMYDLAVAAPYSTLRLLLLRSATVLATSVAVIGGVALVLPDAAATAAWLLPALGLSLATLALASWWDPAVAGAVVGSTWVLLAGELVRRRDMTELNQAEPQLACAVLAVVAAAVVAHRRRHFDLEGTR